MLKKVYNEGRSRRMGQKEKLIQKLKSRPKDFTFDEAETLLAYFTYEKSNKGRTSGSRVMFVSEQYAPILLHRPHPRKELLDYQVKQLLETLEQEGLV
jgi:hypothetical protein